MLPIQYESRINKIKFQSKRYTIKKIHLKNVKIKMLSFKTILNSTDYWEFSIRSVNNSIDCHKWC